MPTFPGNGGNNLQPNLTPPPVRSGLSKTAKMVIGFSAAGALVVGGAGFGVAYAINQNHINTRTQESLEACVLLESARDGFLAEKQDFLNNDLVQVFGDLVNQPVVDETAQNDTENGADSDGVDTDGVDFPERDDTEPVEPEPVDESVVARFSGMVDLVKKYDDLFDVEPPAEILERYQSTDGLIDQIRNSFENTDVDVVCPTAEEFIDNGQYQAAKDRVSVRVGEFSTLAQEMFGEDAGFTLADGETIPLNPARVQRLFDESLTASVVGVSDKARGFLSLVNLASQDEHDAIMFTAGNLYEAPTQEAFLALFAALDQAVATDAAVQAEIAATQPNRPRPRNNANSSSGGSGAGSTGSGSSESDVDSPPQLRSIVSSSPVPARVIARNPEPLNGTGYGGGGGSDGLTLLSKIAEVRSENGLAPVYPNYDLALVAQAYAQKMARGEVPFEHNPNATAQIPGGWLAFGENIANKGPADWTQVDYFMDMWLESPGHRANILGDFTDYGAGWAHNDLGMTYGVQIFATY